MSKEKLTIALLKQKVAENSLLKRNLITMSELENPKKPAPVFGEWQLCPKCNGTNQTKAVVAFRVDHFMKPDCNLCNGAMVIQRPIVNYQYSIGMDLAKPGSDVTVVVKHHPDGTVEVIPSEKIKDTKPASVSYTESEVQELLAKFHCQRDNGLIWTGVFDDWWNRNKKHES